MGIMTSKRRNNGRSKCNRGSVNFKRCNNCYRAVPKDKAIKRFTCKNLADASTQRDIKEASIYANYQTPKTFQKYHYCVSCAKHHRHVKNRSYEERKSRLAPVRFRRQGM